MKNILYIIIALLLTCGVVSAEEEHPEKIASFLSAVEKKDRQEIQKTVDAISESSANLEEYLKEKLPKKYLTYKLYKTSYEFRDLGSGDADEAVSGGRNKYKKGGISNRETVDKFDNQSRVDNGSYARDNANQDRISNSDLVDNFSNRNRQSNRDRLRTGSRLGTR